ncbi:winged helix-turn-helix transcriptional regulator [Microcoleus sp. S13_C5]|uniref:winged helix-turn-helix transcriptional regulator n=1 Tax=Microcoleus sp. S13_C5 TaxID=3055411 RepID=UPI00403F542D
MRSTPAEYVYIPPMVEYSLTSLGEIFLELITTLYEWGEIHLADLAAIATNRENVLSAIERLKLAAVDVFNSAPRVSSVCWI